MISYGNGKHKKQHSILGVLTFFGLVFGTQSAFGQTCIQDNWKNDGNKQNLTCTANDVRIAEATNIRDTDLVPLDSCLEGSTFSFVADFNVVLGAQERFDIGLYFSTDGDESGTGDGAISGQCSSDIITDKATTAPFGSENFIQLDHPEDPGDTCGDINSVNNPQVVTVLVENVQCIDTDGDGTLNLPNCTSWRQSGANDTCDEPTDAFPGSPSKCNCDPDFNVPITVESGAIVVTKNATPESLPEPGGEFTFTVDVENTAQFTSVLVDRICDSDHGTVVNNTTDSCPAGTLDDITGTNCAAVEIAPGATYSCEFTANITSDTPTSEQDIVTVYATDTSSDANQLSDSDDATVSITDVSPSAMIVKAFEQVNCVNASYSISVENTSDEPVTLNSLNDSAFGDITTVQGDVTATDCNVGGTIAPGSAYQCDFDADFCGISHTNMAEAAVQDDDGGQAVTVFSAEVTVDVTASQQ